MAEVEEWAKKNSAKTRQSVFLEQWPSAKIVKVNWEGVALTAVASFGVRKWNDG